MPKVPGFGGWACGDVMRVAPLKELLALIEVHGGNVNQFCKVCGIDPRSVEDSGLCISCSSFLNLLEYCSIQFKVPFFGLELTKLLTLDSFGPITGLVQSASTVREALQFLAKYQSLHAPFMSYSLIDRGDGTTEFCMINRLPRMAHLRQGIELGVGLIVRLLSRISAEFQPSYVRILAEAPEVDIQPIRTLLKCDVMYGQPINSLCIPTSLLGAPLPTHDEFLADLVRDHVNKMRLRGELSLIEQVETLITSLLPFGRCTLELCAWQLGVAPRTLQSRLAAQGADFSDILKSRRQELAEDYLRDTKLALSEIAGLLGYSDQATFTRAFTGWAGMPPSAFRRRQATKKSILIPA